MIQTIWFQPGRSGQTTPPIPEKPIGQPVRPVQDGRARTEQRSPVPTPAAPSRIPSMRAAATPVRRTKTVYLPAQPIPHTVDVMERVQKILRLLFYGPGQFRANMSWSKLRVMYPEREDSRIAGLVFQALQLTGQWWRRPPLDPNNLVETAFCQFIGRLRYDSTCASRQDTGNFSQFLEVVEKTDEAKGDDRFSLEPIYH